MARPRTSGDYREHPHPRYRDKIRLVQKLSGPHDLSWRAQYHIGGAWTPRKPASLSTTDWEEAKEIARDRFAVLEAGGEIASARKLLTDHLFSHYAGLAIDDLRAQGEAARRIDPGKVANYTDLAGRIERVLIPAFGDLDIRKLDDDALTDWATDYRVIDQAATLARYGHQRAKGRQVVLKQPAFSTLGNVDRALHHVWQKAVTAKVVSRRQRPMIDREAYGEEAEPRAFIDTEGCRAVYRLISTDRWLHESNGHTTDYKRLLRLYIALIATAGIRPGLELKRTPIGDVTYSVRENIRVIKIHVRKRAGKHKRERNSVVFEGSIFPTREWLDDVLTWQRARGAGPDTKLFAWDAEDGTERVPQFRDGVKHVLTAAGVLRDPMTSDERVAYSFRHWFATLLIDRGMPTAQIAAWMGTSEYMIHRNYNHWLLDRVGHLHNGGRPLPLPTTAEIENNFKADLEDREPWIDY